MGVAGRVLEGTRENGARRWVKTEADNGEKMGDESGCVYPVGGDGGDGGSGVIKARAGTVGGDVCSGEGGRIVVVGWVDGVIRGAAGNGTLAEAGTAGTCGAAMGNGGMAGTRG